MIKAGYLRGKAAGLTTAKRYFDHRLFPIAVELAGSLELCLQALADRVRGNPKRALGWAFAAGFILSMLATRPPRDGAA